jgi:hypothetical protein
MHSRRGIIRGVIAAVAVGSLVPAAVAMAHSGSDHGPGFGHHHQRYYRASGWVVPSANPATLTVRTFRGRLKSFAVTSSTTYSYGNRSSATAADAAPYRVVDVWGTAPTTSGGNPVASRVVIQLADIYGVVKAETGGTLTVADGDGFTRQISTAGAVCKQRWHTAVSCASIASGSIVTASGQVASDGTTLNARRVEVIHPSS